jgi:hypothetical protein
MMVRTDIRDRGIPWMRLLLERGNRQAAALNTGRTEQLKVLVAACTPALVIASLLFRDMRLAIGALMLLLVLILSNIPTYAWFARERGWGFALQVVPLNLLYYFGNAIAAAIGVWQHLTATRSSAGEMPRGRGADA